VSEPHSLSRRKVVKSLGLAGLSYVASWQATPKSDATHSIRLDTLGESGIHIVELQHVQPDLHGIHLSLSITSAPFEQAVAFAGAWWPAGGNRVYPTILKQLADVPQGTLCALIRYEPASWLAVLPMADIESFSWPTGDRQHLALQLGTLGRAVLNGCKPLFAWSRGTSAYQAMGAAWKIALEAQSSRTAWLREQRPYPEPFRYLGWCSWEAYAQNIDEATMLRAIRAIEDSSVPIRYFLMDEGYADNSTLSIDRKKFPDGFGPLLEQRKQQKIRWFGLWWAFLGAAHGIVGPARLGPLRDALMQSNNGVWLPRPDSNSAARFYHHLFDQTSAAGFDFVKVDFMVDALPLYAGLHKEIPTLGGLPPDNRNAIDNPFAGAALLMRSCQQVASSETDGILNCNWHSAPCLFHSGRSAVGRCSEDYQHNQIPQAKAHIYHAFSAIPWLGQTAWGDHDMFHSSDRVAALPMAISKALSGGPIYLSDEPTTFAEKHIAPLCLHDGRLLRPLAPGTPLEADLFYTPDSGSLFRVLAPLPNACAAFGVFHLETNDAPLTSEIGPQHFRESSNMMQPYPGPWRLPEEGLVLYDVLSRRALRLDKPHTIRMSTFGASLFQLSPVHSGWSMIGAVDKYPPAAAVQNVLFQRDLMQLSLFEAMPCVVWSSYGTPAFKGTPLTPLGPHLFLAEIPARSSPISVTFSR
jgi:hypothetical protein